MPACLPACLLTTSPLPACLASACSARAHVFYVFLGIALVTIASAALVMKKAGEHTPPGIIAYGTAYLNAATFWKVAVHLPTALAFPIGLAALVSNYRRIHHKDELKIVHDYLKTLRAFITAYSRQAAALPGGIERTDAAAAVNWAVAVGNHAQAQLMHSVRDLTGDLAYDAPDFIRASAFAFPPQAEQ